MDRLIFCLLIGGLLFAGCSEEAEENTSTTEEYEPIDTLDLVDTEVEETPELIYIVADPIVDDPCFPYPSPAFISKLESNSVGYQEKANFIYAYVVEHFDSLESKQFEEIEIESEWDQYKYTWTQKFSGGVRFSQSYYGEGGPIATIETECSDFIAIFSTVNAVVNPEIINGDEIDGGEWNEDSTHWGPNIGVGCFYEIEFNDSTETYYVDNYCGC